MRQQHLASSRPQSAQCPKESPCAPESNGVRTRLTPAVRLVPLHIHGHWPYCHVHTITVLLKQLDSRIHVG